MTTAPATAAAPGLTYQRQAGPRLVQQQPVRPGPVRPESAEPVEALMPDAPDAATPASLAAALSMTLAAATVIGLYVGVPLLSTIVVMVDDLGSAVLLSLVLAGAASLGVWLILRATLSRISPFPGRHVAGVPAR